MENAEDLKTAFGVIFGDRSSQGLAEISELALLLGQELEAKKAPTANWINILNAHSTTRPKSLGGPVNPPIDKSHTVSPFQRTSPGGRVETDFVVALRLPNAF